MAFKDITKVLYNGKVKIDYKDKAHRYYARMRENWELPVEDAKAWGKIMYPKGTTTLLGDTLEKKGLMQWPKNVALRELFGFYAGFTGDNGKEIPAGFSKGVGTMWKENLIMGISAEDALPLIESAAKGWQRKQKKGADIGSVVHDAIEHFVTNQPFDIAEQYLWNIKECEYETEEAREEAIKEMPEDVAMATQAFLQFQIWWEKMNPELLGAEDLVYSLEHNICGTFDGLIKIDNKTILCDWKTSNAYKDAPEGVSYDYFIQSAIYAMAWMEMGNDPIDDLMIVSCRKDGQFSTVSASELGFTVQECINWAKAVIVCYRAAEKAKVALLERAPKEEKAEDPDQPKAKPVTKGKLNNQEAF